MAFRFPFTTCETNTKGVVSQPFSATVNAITCLLLLSLSFFASTNPIRLLLISFTSFEAWHTFSHVKHIEGNIQTNVVHGLAYFMAFSTLYAILHLSKNVVSIFLSFLIISSVIIDVYIFFYVKGIWNVLSGLVIFAVIVFGNYHSLPRFFKEFVPYLIMGLILLFVLIANESYNCEKMTIWKNLPYHVAIEIIGFFLFTSLSYLFLKWESCSIHLQQIPMSKEKS
jgi:hypothetical protein